MKRRKDRTLKDKLPRSVGAPYATGDQWRNNFRKNEGMEPKQKQQPKDEKVWIPWHLQHQSAEKEAERGEAGSAGTGPWQGHSGAGHPCYLAPPCHGFLVTKRQVIATILRRSIGEIKW